MEILVVRVAAVVRLIFSHTGGYGNTGSKGSQGAMEIRVARVVRRVAKSYSHIQGAMEIWVARVVRVAAVVKVIFSQYRGLWKYG